MANLVITRLFSLFEALIDVSEMQFLTGLHFYTRLSKTMIACKAW